MKLFKPHNFLKPLLTLDLLQFSFNVEVEKGLTEFDAESSKIHDVVQIVNNILFLFDLFVLLMQHLAFKRRSKNAGLVTLQFQFTGVKSEKKAAFNAT